MDRHAITSHFALPLLIKTPSGLVVEVTEATWLEATKIQPHFAIAESPAYVGRAVVTLAQDPDVSRWNGASLSSGQLARVY